MHKYNIIFNIIVNFVDILILTILYKKVVIDMTIVYN